MTQHNTILFDLDGTLLDTATDMANALNQLRHHHSLPPLPLKSIRPHVGYGSRALLKLAFDLDDKHPDYPTYLEAFFNAYEEHMNRTTQLFKGMETVLKTLENADRRWGIITNKPERFTLRILQHLQLHQRAAIVICGDTLAKRKPNPDQLHFACQQLNTRAQECVYIGDTETDVIASRAANMPVIAALYGYISESEDPYTWQADHYITQPIQILDYLT